MKQATKVAAVVARSIDRLSEALGLAAGIVVLLFTLLIVYEVVARKVFDAPLGFVFELSTYLPLSSASFSAPFSPGKARR
jgi:TRAP-type mannitol/chloroaromatic compound transport system permease small subunit